jgi:hypothetical protein
MPEPSPLHVVVRDLTDALRPERLPAQIFPAVPPAGRTGQPLSLRAGFLLCRGPASDDSHLITKQTISVNAGVL